ncbi:MAG: MarR family winged helix-turn-helix transcriptional regulator, partial [Clostridia bacterium]
MEHDHSTAHKLLKAFMMFRRAEWQNRTVLDLKPSEIKVLLCIKRALTSESPQIKVSEISKRMQVTSPTVTQLLNGMEANGLIERNMDPHDRRSVGVKLTEKGEDITRQATEAFLSRMNGLIEHLGEEKSNQLAELLFEVFDYTNKVMAE